MSATKYFTLKELAPLFGMTQRTMGLALQAIGLWIVGEGPTDLAYDEGYVNYRYYPGFEQYPGYVWDHDKTIAALEEAGYERVNDVA